jgi:hypothetical protein
MISLSLGLISLPHSGPVQPSLQPSLPSTLMSQNILQDGGQKSIDGSQDMDIQGNILRKITEDSEREYLERMILSSVTDDSQFAGDQSDANESHIPQPVSGQEDIELALRLSEMSEEEAFQFAMKESTSPRNTGLYIYMQIFKYMYIYTFICRCFNYFLQIYMYLGKKESNNMESDFKTDAELLQEAIQLSRQMAPLNPHYIQQQQLIQQLSGNCNQNANTSSSSSSSSTINQGINTNSFNNATNSANNSYSTSNSTNFPNGGANYSYGGQEDEEEELRRAIAESLRR